MTNILDRIKNEPAAITGAVVAAITLAVAFGVPISSDQRSAIVGIVGAVLSLLGAGVVRSQVTPTRKVETLPAAYVVPAGTSFVEAATAAAADTPDPAAFADKAAPTTVVRVIPRTDPRLGRAVEHDPRSRAFPAPATAPIVSKTWRHYGPILDQGQTPSCVGNAFSQMVNTKPLHMNGRILHEADAQKVYDLATQLDDLPGQAPQQQGSTGLGGAKAMVSLGYAAAYVHAFGLEHTLGALMNGPVALGTPWLEGMFTPDARGVVNAAGAVAGGHEYLLIGVDLAKQQVECLNSWGISWGKRGRFFMSLSDLDKLLSMQGDATQLVV